MKTKNLLLAVLLVLVLAHPIAMQARDGGVERLIGASTWLGSQPLTAVDLEGKVVVVDFWTYTCINWLRSMPYVRAWADKYKDRGLVVVGVHTPEFAFERDVENVRRAVGARRISYPIAIDNESAIWRAFDNDGWPALYILDAKGRIRYRHLGEGEYERAERIIQQLLAEAGATGIASDLVSPDASGPEVAADWESVRSAENYLGYERTQGFTSPGAALHGKPRTYSAPARFELNEWALSGNWTTNEDAVVLNQAGGRIAYRFRARDLHLVMGPSTRGTPVRFRVSIDGKPPLGAHGGDIDEQGYGTVDEQRLYQLIRQPQPIGDRQFEIVFLEPGVAAFAFTFG